MFHLLFGPEDGGSTFLRNIGKILLAYGVIIQKTVTVVIISSPAYEVVYSVLFRTLVYVVLFFSLALQPP
jgi:hypothetical protein